MNSHIELSQYQNLQTKTNPVSLRDSVQFTVQNYLATVGGKHINNLHELVVNEVERALIERVLDYTDGNESRTAKILGISRGTLRQRRKQFGHYDKKYHNDYDEDDI